MLQEIAKKVIKEEMTDLRVILSGGINTEDVLTPAEMQRHGSCKSLPDLMFHYEEADWRIIPHIDWNVKNRPT